MSGRRMTAKGDMAMGTAGPAIMHLPPPLRAMFEPRPPLKHLGKASQHRPGTTAPPYTGLAALLGEFESATPPARVLQETPPEARAKSQAAKKVAAADALAARAKAWDPKNPPPSADGHRSGLTADAYKTLFVGRLSYDTTESKLRREFEQFGEISSLRIVCDADSRPRGYAFVGFEREEDMKSAFRRADGRKIDNRRIVVDVERGRTVRDWKPRKLGGGLGSTRRGPPSMNSSASGRATTAGAAAPSSGAPSSARSNYAPAPAPSAPRQQYGNPPPPSAGARPSSSGLGYGGGGGGGDRRPPPPPRDYESGSGGYSQRPSSSYGGNGGGGRDDYRSSRDTDYRSSRDSSDYRGRDSSRAPPAGEFRRESRDSYRPRGRSRSRSRERERRYY